MIQESIFTKASGTAGLTALIGSSPCRFYPMFMPERPTYPAVVYHEVSSTRDSAMGSDPKLVHARYQLDAWDTTRIGARDLNEQLRLAFQRWRGTVGGVVIQDTFIDSQDDFPPELVDGVLLHRRSSDIMVHYLET